MSGREQILGAVRAALGDVAPGEPAAWERERDDDPAAAYRRGAELTEVQRVERFAERCGEYSATVTRCAAGPGAIAAAVGEICRRQDARLLAVAAGLDPEWIPEGIEVRRDDPPLTIAQLDGCDGALTDCAAAIAETGSLVLDGGPAQGRRALTLVADLHLCVVAARDVVASVPEAVERAAIGVRERRAPLTFISGPSATSDIELARVEGVHGPRRLEVILVG